MYDWKMSLYWFLPIKIQEIILSYYARYLDNIYYSSEYYKWKEKFDQWKGWSLSQIKTWQNNQLQYILDVAATQVPYYKKHWQNISWKQITSIEDLSRLPLLEKQAIRQNELAFINENIKIKNLWMEKTSGSTGTSLHIYWPLDMLPKWWAITEVMIREVAGVSQKLPRAMLGGRPIVAGKTNSPPYWRYNRRWKQLYLSSYHVSEKTAYEYIEAIRRYDSQWLTGYGSSIASLAEFAIQGGMKQLPLQAAIVSGDTLFHGMRKSIETFFKTKCYDQYGQCEGVAMAMECAYGNLHLIPFVGITEILCENDSPCIPGQVGEIVATTLLNDAMPLIRYRTGDYAAWAPDQSCACGNTNSIITNLEGRVDDYLITNDGRKIGRLSTAMKRSPTIHSAQIVQDEPGHAYLLIRPGNGYQHAHSNRVRADIIERIGTYNLDVLEVEEIPVTPQGKTKLVVRLKDNPGMWPMYKGILQNAN